VKLLDLGLALLHEGDASIARNLTDTGQVMGTLDYMAPEQADDTHAVDIRADIYSLGCTLYSLLAGEPPFAGPQFTTAVKKLAAHMQKPFPPLAERCDDIPAELQTILDRMVAKSPADRFVTPGEVAAAIKPLTTGHDLAALLGRATQGKSPTPSGSVHETFAFLSSAFTATQPATPSNQLAPTIDKLAATETLHSTPRRRVPKLGLFAAVGLIVLLVVCAVFMQSGKQAPLDESKVASTLRRAEPSPPSADPQSTLDSNSSSSPEGSSRRSVTATLPDSSTPALDPPLSTLDFPEPPPLEEWLQGREILTVKQDGSAMFTKIQDALNALKPGQVVEVLDKGPYGENLYQRMLDDVGLVSRTQTRVFANGPPSAFDGTPTFHFFNTSRAFRLSGLTFLANANNEGDEATVKVFARGDVLVEDCCFLTPTIADDRFVERALVVVPSESTPQLLVCRRNLILGRLEFNLLGQTHAVYLRQNYIGGASSAPLACSGYPGTIQLRENVVHTAFDSRIRAPSAISLRRSTNQPVTVQSPVRFVANRNTVAAAECAFMVDGWDDESSFVSSGNIYFARKVTNRGSHVIPVTNDTFLQMESADPSRSDISFDRDNPVCFRLQTPDATGATAVGALAPGPAPPEGDWFTRLLDRWKEAQEDLKRMGLEK
jgi:serine/threonine protein kinase